MEIRLTRVVLVLAIFTCTIGSVSAALTVGDLRCEYLQNPIGLDEPKPRLSWRIGSDQRNTHQTAFRILVASSPSLLDQNRGDFWDSGKIASDQSIQVEYAGKPLATGDRCFWKVQSSDDHGATSPWSSPASWTMGLLQADDWKGKWIGSATSPDDTKKPSPPPAPMLRKGFAIGKPIRRATAYVCSLGYYELYLNGGKVGDHVLDPPVTQFNKRALYVTYDVTPQLRTGKNAVGVELGSSWYNSAPRDAWNFYRAAWRALPQMRLQIDIEFNDGTHQQIVTDDSWKLSTGPLLYDQTRVGEIYDARLEKPDWSTATYDDAGWQPVAIREGEPGVVSASNVEPVKIVATIKPVKITQPKPGIYVFDMGQNLAGWPKLTVSGPAGTSIHLRCGELLHKDGTVDLSNINTLVKSPEVQCDTYILKGQGVETWEPRFTFHGFQYVQAEGLPGEANENTVQARVIHTSFDPAGSFECSDPMLNKIEHAAIWAYQSNFVGIPSDCPHREKNGWTGDAQLAVAMGLEHFHGEAAYTQWIQTLEDCMRSDGKLPCIAPSTTWGYNRLDGPAWESAYELVPWEMYLQSGDARILERHYEGFKKWIDWYTKKAKDNIVSYGLGDWAPVKTKTPGPLTSTGYYYRDLRIIAATAKLLNKSDDERHYTELADQVREAFNKAFYDPATGEYAGGTQTGLSCALYQDLLNETDRAKVVQNLADAVTKADNHIDTGILGAKYILRALSDNGQGELAWKMATQHTAPSWGSWIDSGATTLWEEWDGSSSRNHIMFGDISSWFVEYLAGIRADPAGPGYQKFIIHPLLIGDLTSAKATRDSMFGTIDSEWTRTDNAVTLKVTIPANTTATVYIPATAETEVTESGKPAATADGVKFLKMDGTAAMFSVGSGVYEFASKVK